MRLGAEVFLHLALGQRSDQTAREMATDREPERLRNEEIDRAAGQKRRHRMKRWMDEQKPEARAQRQQEERHRSRDDATHDRQTPGEPVARVFVALIGDNERVGHQAWPVRSQRMMMSGIGIPTVSYTHLTLP